jgi:hypothetical protein
VRGNALEPESVVIRLLSRSGRSLLLYTVGWTRLNCGAGGGYIAVFGQLGIGGFGVEFELVGNCCNRWPNRGDLSLSAAEALGMIEWDGSPSSGVRWKAVGCPVTESIYVMYNGKDTQQPYYQNLAYPIATAKVGDQNGTLNTGFWMFNGNVAGKTVTLTDTMGHTITGTMPSAAGSLGVQFPTTCN